MALTDLLHIETVSADKRRVECVMPITPDLFQPHGYLHGGATIALLETVASIGAEQGTDFERERPFGVDVRVRHRKGGRKGMLRGVAALDREEVSERTVLERGGVRRRGRRGVRRRGHDQDRAPRVPGGERRGRRVRRRLSSPSLL